MSYQFYEGQMSGNLPAWNQLLYSKLGGWKKSAHLKDGSDINADLSGGYYDAGGQQSGHHHSVAPTVAVHVLDNQGCSWPRVGNVGTRLVSVAITW